MGRNIQTLPRPGSFRDKLEVRYGMTVPVCRYQLSVIGFLFSVLGYQLSVFGYRFLVIGFLVIGFGFRYTEFGNRVSIRESVTKSKIPVTFQ